jgi:hypothetical protein
MRDIIGKFAGRRVYKTNTTDYINKRLYNNVEDIFLINREMIYKNEVFATYDGTYVKELDYNQKYEFYRIPEPATVEAKVVTDGKGVKYVEYETNLSIPVGNSKNETKTSTEKVDVEATIAGVYDTDYFSGMTDIDAFLKNALES